MATIAFVDDIAEVAKPTAAATPVAAKETN
jgi:hypothetical protein